MMERDILQTFPLNDRVANYGDGVFTTMSVEAGRVALFERHVKRLCRDTRLLGVFVDAEQLRADIIAQAQSIKSGTLKLLISAGQGGRGYQRDEKSAAALYFSHHSVPAHYNAWRVDGICLGLSDVRIAVQPVLAGIKHCNRLEQVLVKRHMSTAVDDVLVCDTDNHIVEASAANVFWLNQGQWYTPSVKQCGVAGVMREFVIDWLHQHGQPVSEVQALPNVLNEASAIFLTNALMQIIPVHTLELEEPHHLATKPVTTLQDEIKLAYQDEFNAV